VERVRGPAPAVRRAGAVRAGGSGGTRTGRRVRAPNASASLAAVQLYAAVAGGDADAVERGRALEPEWPRDGQVALLAGGCTVDALTWAGELDEAVDLALALIEHLGRVWTDYFLGGIWLAALGIAALADAARAERLAGKDPAARLRLGTELLERAVTTAQRGRPRGGRLGPEGGPGSPVRTRSTGVWWARTTRRCGRPPPRGPTC
jgi:hypothetical protein